MDPRNFLVVPPDPDFELRVSYLEMTPGEGPFAVNERLVEKTYPLLEWLKPAGGVILQTISVQHRRMGELATLDFRPPASDVDDQDDDQDDEDAG